MRFFEGGWPLLVAINPVRTTDAELESMFAGYERYFARGDRYALMTVSPRGAESPGARERKRMADWASSPRVREFSRKLCVGSATVVTSAVMQGALTAIMWIWKPTSPHLAVRNVNEGMAFCFERLGAERISLPRKADELKRIILAELEGVV